MRALLFRPIYPNLPLQTCAITFVVTALFTSLNASAADSPFNLDTIVVSGSRNHQPLADTPIRVQLMDQKTIKRLHTRDVRDALRMIPGIQLREIHGKTGTEVMIQGFSGDRVLVLVDGLPVSATTGSTVDVSQLSTLNIEHIEVIPGAASSLYGSAAMGGVINIITSTDDVNKSGLSGALQLEGGTYGEKDMGNEQSIGQQHVSARTQFTTPTFSTSISADLRHSEGFDLDPDTYVNEGYAGDKSNLAFSFTPLVLVNDTHFKVEQYIEDTEINRLSNAGFEGKRLEDLTRTRLSVASNEGLPILGDSSIQILHEVQEGTVKQLNNDDSLNVGNLWRDTEYQQSKFTWQKSHLVNNRLFPMASDTVFGYEFFTENIDQYKEEVDLSSDDAASNAIVTALDDGTFLIQTPEVTDVSRSSHEVFSQFQIPVTQTLELSPGVRAQEDSDFGFHASPTISSRYTHDMGSYDLQFRNSYGMGYRVPNLKNRYYEFDHSVYGYKVLGDPDLKPETSYSFQSSISITDHEFVHLEASIFHNRILDLIETINSGETESNGAVTVYRYTNYAHTMTRGYELASQLKLGPVLEARLSFSYLDTQDTDTHLPLINRSKHHMKLLLLWDYSTKLNFVLSGEYQSEFYTDIDDDNRESSPGYQIWDIKTNYQLLSDASVFAGVNNLFDVVRDTNDSFDRRPIEGRKVYIGTGINF